MQLLSTLSRAAGLGLCVVAFTGSALADPGKGNGNGPESTPPGQEQKAETPAATAGPAPQAAGGQEQKAGNKPAPAAAAKAAPPGQQKQAANQQKQAAKQQAKPAKQAVTPAGHSGSDSNGRSAEAHHHVIVCHATGSASNPYVVINIPWTAWTEGHSRHGDRSDKLLKDPASRPGSKDGFDKSDCAAPGPSSTTQNQSSQQSTTTCPATVTTTERVLVGIKHYTGAVKNGQREFVVISPRAKSAHLNGKHADDAAIFETRTVTRSFSGENCASVISTNTTNTTNTTTTTTTSNVSSTESATNVASTQASVEAAQPAAGGVAGAVSPSAKKAKAKPAGGVLGAIASAPEAIASTATGTLPFTGIPLWVAALIGMALLAAGLTLRRSA